MIMLGHLTSDPAVDTLVLALLTLLLLKVAGRVIRPNRLPKRERRSNQTLASLDASHRAAQRVLHDVQARWDNAGETRGASPWDASGSGTTHPPGEPS